MSDTASVTALVLAAGQSTRMVSATPKVLHRICGASLLEHVLSAVADAGIQDVVVVAGRDHETVAAHVAQLAPRARVVVQEPQLGTGHAARVGLGALAAPSGTVLVLPGDGPLLRAATLRRLVEERERTGCAAVVLTAQIDDPSGYGRVLRSDDGSPSRIVEHRDADPATRSGREIATSTYAFDAATLARTLPELGRDNAAGEEYLTDVVGLLHDAGAKLSSVTLDDPAEAMGVNDRVQLAAARRAMRDRLLDEWMRRGVTVVDPGSTWLGVHVRLAPDVTVHPNTQLLGHTSVAAGAVVGPNATLRDTSVGEAAHVRDATCEGAEIGPEAEVGPYTYLRPGTRLGRGAKAGGFVEMKAAVVGEDSKVPHLSYVGDAEIGARSNVGAATVFVNYDGVAKHRTVVGDDVRIGSDTMLVAPVTVGDGSYTAAGSVVTTDVPPGALAIARARQRNIDGWVTRARPGTPAAEAAERANRSPDEEAASAATEGDDG